MKFLQSSSELIRSIVNKRTPINEFDDLKEKIFEYLALWMREIKKDDVTIIMDYKLCVGKFASYTIYIPKLTWLWIDDLKKIKGYEMWSVSRWQDGLKLHCSSNRVESETVTHEIQKVKSVG